MTAKELLIADPSFFDAANARIEAYRKGDFTLRVPSDKAVHIRLKKHAFRFGANLLMLDEFPDDTERKNKIYREKFAALFNMATLPFYWCDVEPEEGKTRYAVGSPRIYRRPPVDLCLEFCEEHGIEPREHALAYEHNFPAWLKGRDDAAVKAALRRRMREISERYAHRIPTIEVTNEMNWKDSVTDFYFSPDYLPECYRMAAEYFPDNELCINEWGTIWRKDDPTQEKYFEEIRRLLEAGCRVDAIGMQFHVFVKKDVYVEKTRSFYDLPHIYGVLDRFASFGKPVEITEVTIPAHGNSAQEEETQADLIEALYTAWFSHPAVKQIIYWNLADGYAWQAEPGDMTAGENIYYGGLLRFDLSEKPAYRRLERLFHEKWHTELDAAPDKDGRISFRGFYGDYELTIDGKTYDISLPRSGEYSV